MRQLINDESFQTNELDVTGIEGELPAVQVQFYSVLGHGPGADGEMVALCLSKRTRLDAKTAIAVGESLIAEGKRVLGGPDLAVVSSMTEAEAIAERAKKLTE